MTNCTATSIEALGPLIVVDLPGFGRSEGRPDLMSPEAMGEFVIKLAQHFGIDRMHAVGPDVGTLALLFAAVRNPGLFESLVVGSGATSPELAAGGLKDLIEAPAGAFDSVEVPARSRGRRRCFPATGWSGGRGRRWSDRHAQDESPGRLPVL